MNGVESYSTHSLILQCCGRSNRNIIALCCECILIASNVLQPIIVMIIIWWTSRTNTFIPYYRIRWNWMPDRHYWSVIFSGFLFFIHSFAYIYILQIRSNAKKSLTYLIQAIKDNDLKFLLPLRLCIEDYRMVYGLRELRIKWVLHRAHTECQDERNRYIGRGEEGEDKIEEREERKRNSNAERFDENW